MAIKDRFNLIRDKKTGVDELVDKILTDGTPEKSLYSKALTFYTSPVRKKYIESCLIATEDISEISRILSIEEEVLEVYSKIFYDVQGLDKLSRLELLEVPDKEEAMMKTWALSQGLDFIVWRLGGNVQVDPVDGLNELFTLATYKSKEALFTSNSSEASKEAVKWVKTSMDLARLMKAWVLDSDAAKKDIELALREVIPDFGGLDTLGDDLGIDLGLLTTQEVNLNKLPGNDSD
ncbi:MAG TPA: hypothetical protein VN922_21715 [Bacteroidia bacterium]|nr:hypothetical protein [Bacteroidia bacterium]